MHSARSAALVLVVLVTISYSPAALPAVPDGAPRPTGPTGVDNSGVIDINNIRMSATNTGSFAYDKVTGNAGLEFPKGTGRTAVFAAGLWLGAHVGSDTRLAMSDYSDEYQPGAMFGGLPDDPGLAAYHTYRLYRMYADVGERDAALADYAAGAVPYGAPPVVVQLDGSLSIIGDQMLWSVYNDANPAAHTNYAGGTAPLGVEVQQTTYAFNRQGALGNTVFIRFKITNRGLNSLDDMIAGLWSDPDVGGASDDLVGCDTTRSLGFAYNATNSDLVYGSRPPAVGYVLLRGPLNGIGAPLGMTAFTKHINGTDPSNFLQAYSMLQGLNHDGSPIISPIDGLPTHFMDSGDPLSGSGWLDASPADRRLLLASGPFHMAPGDVQVIDYALVIGQARDRLSSVSSMRFAVDVVRAFFGDGPTPTLASLVDANAEPGRVTLSWYGADLAGRFVTLERRTASVDWSAVSSRFADGSGSIAFEDLDVTAGMRYAYRIAVRVNGADSYSSETWVDVPAESRLSLAGFRPNPSAGDVFVDFSLASSEAATLRVFDIAGRAVFTREVGSLGAGRHQFRLDGGAALKAGAYVMQISQGGRTVMRRGVIVR